MLSNVSVAFTNSGVTAVSIESVLLEKLSLVASLCELEIHIDSDQRQQDEAVVDALPLPSNLVSLSLYACDISSCLFCAPVAASVAHLSLASRVCTWDSAGSSSCKHSSKF